MKKIILFAAVLLLAPVAASAHQPRMTDNQTEVTVTSPEVSKAYYGYLGLAPVNFIIDSPVAFDLYVGLLVPDLPDSRKDLAMKIYKDDQLVTEIKSYDGDWKPFWEPFGGDNYFQGPEYRKRAEAGKYRIEVYRPIISNGKYVVAIGETESFTAGETLKTLATLPRVKAFFNKSPFTAYFNQIGLIAGAALLVGVALIICLVMLIKVIIRFFKK